jgi:hypothetical protein
MFLLERTVSGKVGNRMGTEPRGQQVPIFLLCGIALHVTVAVGGGMFLLSRLH